MPYFIKHAKYLHDALLIYGGEMTFSTEPWLVTEDLMRLGVPAALLINEKGKTLLERIKAGNIKIGPNVFVGRQVYIEDDAEVRYSDLEKYTRIGEGAVLGHVYLSPYSEIGPCSSLSECALGLQVRVDSSKKSPTHINGGSVLGPEINVLKGTRLNNVQISPGFKFAREGLPYKNEILEPTDDQIKTITDKYRIPRK